MSTTMHTGRADALEWVNTLCEQFAKATGWPLHFTAGEKPALEAWDTSAQDPAEQCWHTEVNDGQGRVGTLAIGLPEHVQDDHTFLAVCELADVVAQLLGRVLAASAERDATVRDMSTLVDIGKSLPREDDLLSALGQLLRASVQLTGFRSAGFFLLDSATSELTLRVSHQLDAQKIPCRRRNLQDHPPDLEALANGLVVLQRQEAPQNANWLPEDSWTGMCVPVESEAGPIGSLWAYDRRRRVPTDRETHVLESLAAQIAAVLERVVLLRESADQRRMQRELQVITENQIEDFSSQLHDHARIEVVARCYSRHEIGGDLYDVIRISDHQTAIAIGDASGDGLPAAIIMTAVRGALWALMSSGEHVLDTKTMIEQINRALFHITPPHQFMTFLYGVIDTKAMTFAYTNAGHPPPIFTHDTEIETLHSHGMLLGVSESAEYRQSIVQLSPGDLLILFSDGIVEAKSNSRQMFRNSGVISAFEGRLDGSAEDVLQAVWQEYELHAAGGGDPDDRTLMVVKVSS